MDVYMMAIHLMVSSKKSRYDIDHLLHISCHRCVYYLVLPFLRISLYAYPSLLFIFQISINIGISERNCICTVVWFFCHTCGSPIQKGNGFSVLASAVAAGTRITAATNSRNKILFIVSLILSIVLFRVLLLSFDYQISSSVISSREYLLF